LKETRADKQKDNTLKSWLTA